MTELFWTLRETSMTILDALMMGLAVDDVESEELRKLHSGHNNQLRLSHYPPVSAELLDIVAKDRLTAHRDWWLVYSTTCTYPVSSWTK